MQERKGRLVEYWKERLGIDDYAVITERISLFQVSDDYCRVGNSFVGVCADHDEKVACIYHTRRLREDDIVHELLHVRHPSWTEDEVNRAAAELLLKTRQG
ncbi:hypothetical protein [Nitrososphaera viennensis]|uniref:hypothetical protein n=1 Tax=Nitrososphaera viennensis TaxID=1034015 RepID=UPI00130EBA3A|nr:hypothetical protein [Nitrososphaera viennensis]